MAGSLAPTAPPPPGASAETDAGEAAESDRPTAIPTFDLESFARLQTASNGPETPAKAPSGEWDMLDHLALGDAERALEACRLQLKIDPKDPVALRYEPMICAELDANYVKTLGSLLRIPVHARPMAELARLPLDHRMGFVLSLVDGGSNFDTILVICGMPRLDALRTLCGLLSLGAITVT